MKLPFRHGLVRYQTDIAHNPIFVRKAAGGSAIDLVVSPDPTLLTIAHFDVDYLYEERKTILQAWTGFVSGTDYWIYWDIDLQSGVRTFGSTTLEPVSSLTAPVSPAVDQHWFDKNEKVMKRWTGQTWREVLRVFAAFYDEGTILNPYPVGTQVGLSTRADAGSILFDDEEKPIRKFTRGRRSTFITSESILSTAISGQIVSFTFENSLNVVEAVEPIPEWSLICFKGALQIGLASPNISNPIIGIVSEDFTTGQLGSYINKGFITNENWGFGSANFGQPLFCSPAGQVTLLPPQLGYIQQIGHVVNTNTIYLDPKIVIEL